MADYRVKLDSSQNYTVSQQRTVVAEFLSDLADVSVPNLDQKGNYILSYDANLKKYVLVPADQVLEKASEDSELPAQFVQQLDQDLDNKIDFDGGQF